MRSAVTDTIVEVGPAAVRGPGAVDAESASVALDCLDDRIALVDDEPVAVTRLWGDVLRSAAGGCPGTLMLVCPSWWPAAHTALVCDAARTVAPDVVVMTRAQLLMRGASRHRAVLEIAADFVVVSRAGAVAVAVPRVSDPAEVADAVAAEVAGAPDVVIDAPEGVEAAPWLGAAIADLVRRGGGTVRIADRGHLARAAATMPEPQPKPETAGVPRAPRRGRGIAMLTGAVVAAAAVIRYHTTDPPPMPMTLLVEGRVGVTVPAQWRAERITAGPGSARIQLVSPGDDHTALHITQSPLPGGQTLATAAEVLRAAFDGQPSGVFADFNPDDRRAGRPVISYRELRPEHHIRWAVLVDGPVRIGIGCQSPPARAESERHACDEAIRTAHAVF